MFSLPCFPLLSSVLARHTIMSVTSDNTWTHWQHYSNRMLEFAACQTKKAFTVTCALGSATSVNQTIICTINWSPQGVRGLWHAYWDMSRVWRFSQLPLKPCNEILRQDVTLSLGKIRPLWEVTSLLWVYSNALFSLWVTWYILINVSFIVLYNMKFCFISIITMKLHRKTLLYCKITLIVKLSTALLPVPSFNDALLEIGVQ